MTSANFADAQRLMGCLQDSFSSFGKEVRFSREPNVRPLPVTQEVAGWNPFASAAIVSGWPVIPSESMPSVEITSHKPTCRD